MTDLTAFYAKLDESIPDGQTMLINGQRVILSTQAYGKLWAPETRDEWIVRIEGDVRACLAAPLETCTEKR